MAGSLDRAQGSKRNAPLRAQNAQNYASSHPGSSSFTLEEFFILAVLQDRELYGLQIVSCLAAYSEFGISLGMGVIYPVLKNLVKEGVLRSHHAYGGPARVYYALTDLGRERFNAIAGQLAHLGKIAQLLAVDIRPLA